VNPAVIERNVWQVLPYIATENILMAAVAAGGDRQKLHEKIRRYSHQAAARAKAASEENTLLADLKADPDFAAVNFDQVIDKGNFIGRAPQQVDEFIIKEILPIRKHYSHLLHKSAEIAVLDN
jgi:adenylosuccinate lyase